MTKNQRDFWRDEFLPEQLAKYSKLKKLDYVDDLAQRLEDKPELVNLLSDGAYGSYVRETLKQTTETGVNPVATATDLAADPIKMAEHAKAIGKGDPNFAYRLIGREAGSDDAELGQRGRRFKMNHGLDNLPSFSMEILHGDVVTELQADVRPEASTRSPEPWFEKSPAGEKARTRARISLSKGEPINLSGEEIGVRPGDVPDRFREELTEDGLLRKGIVGLGLSQSIDLLIEITIGGQATRETIPLYAIPPIEPAALAFGGHYLGTVITLDFESVDDAEVEPDEIALEMVCGLSLVAGGLRASDALEGLAFAQAFEKAERIYFQCPQILPPEGIAFSGREAPSAGQEMWNVAAVVAAALAGLEARDGVERTMPEAVEIRDRYAAQMTFQVLQEGKLEIGIEDEFDLPLNLDIEGKKLEDLLDLQVELPPILGQPTGVMVRRQLLDLEPLKIVNPESGPPLLKLKPAAGGGKVLITLI
ncbi:MAG: hypothetical protein M3Y75_06835 [Actinomycetota bacterium]|nr:hypothetical protein [Actinomycetota bacterium]